MKSYHEGNLHALTIELGMKAQPLLALGILFFAQASPAQFKPSTLSAADKPLVDQSVVWVQSYDAIRQVVMLAQQGTFPVATTSTPAHSSQSRASNSIEARNTFPRGPVRGNAYN